MSTDRVSQRFQAATNALKEVNAWLERKGIDPPACIVERMDFHQMSAEEYYAYWKSFAFLDPRQNVETQAIEYGAIWKVQPDWRPKP